MARGSVGGSGSSGGGSRGFSGGGNSRGFSGGRSLGGSGYRTGSSFGGGSSRPAPRPRPKPGPGYGGPGGFGPGPRPGYYPPPPPPLYRPRRHYNRSYRRSNNTFWAVIIVLVLFLFIFNCMGLLEGGSWSITKSTVERKPLNTGHLVTAEYIIDDTGQFTVSRTIMEKGMKYFYKETGVQPTIYIDDDINGDYAPSDSVVESYMNTIYDETFKDEGHLLVFYLYNTNGDDKVWALAGNEAEMVIDQEARDILLDYFSAYYYRDDLDNSEYVSKVFESTADRIMTVTKSPIVTIAIIVGIIIVLLILIKFWKARKRQKNLEADQTERIINTPVEKLGSMDDLGDLKEKYDNNDKN